MKLQGERERERLSASEDCLFGLDKSSWKSWDNAQNGKEMPSIPVKWYLLHSLMLSFLVQMNKLLFSL